MKTRSILMHPASSAFTAVSWDFGDPSTSSDVSTNISDSYTYPPVSVPTDFIASLTVTNNVTGCVQDISRTITIYPDTIIAGISDDSICAGEVISLFQNSPDATGVLGNTRWTFNGSFNFFSGLGVVRFLQGLLPKGKRLRFNLPHLVSTPLICAM